jgi:poly(beta-D-mannuronate) lyase
MVADGTYGSVAIGAKGTAAAPIVVRAVNPLKASTTTLTFTMASWVVVEGFTHTSVTITDSDHCRVSRCQVSGGAGVVWIGVTGSSDSARIDHCEVTGSALADNVFNPTDLSTNTLIDHNYVHDVTGAHVVDLGCCGPMYDYHDTGDIVEFNLFSKANGSGAELLTIKSSKSTFRYNTVVQSNGDLDIRSGRQDAIYGNYVFNQGIGSGIRLYEDNHEIYDNYIESTRALQVGPSGTGHARVTGASIVFNTFVGPVNFGDDLNTTFSNNVVIGNVSAGNPTTPTYQANIVFMGSGPSTGFLKVDPKLARSGTMMTDPLMITASSPAVGAAVGSFPFVTDDIQGKPRGAKADIGAEQWSTGPATRPVLTAADVGPNAP